jgi:hypothetical protein
VNFRLPFRTTAARWWVALALGVLAALGAVSAQGFDARTRTVTVAPSGGDDTMAIRQAFATCIAVGPGCTVQLTEGTFLTRQHVIEGFHGAFVGAGMDRTFIEPLAPLYVNENEMVLMDDPTDEAPWPILFLFVGANMTMADLGFRVTAFEVTTPWNIFGTQFTALATVVSLTGEGARVDVERIAMEAGEGTFFGVNVVNGVFVQGILPGPSGGFGDRPSASGTFTVRDSRFDGLDSGVVMENLDGATVSVRDSVFDGVFTIAVSDVSDSLVEIANNDITALENGIDIIAGMFRQPAAVSRIVISGNTLRVAADGQGVTLADEADVPTLQLLLDGNVFELDDALAGIAGFAHGAVLRDNVMRGTAGAGVRVGVRPHDDDDEPTPLADTWVLAGNDLSALTAETAAVWLTADARDAVVVCAGAASVQDEGERSLVTCD